MEKLQHLISKLNEQCEQNESALQMLVTLKQIEAELDHNSYHKHYGQKKPGCFGCDAFHEYFSPCG